MPASWDGRLQIYIGAKLPAGAGLLQIYIGAVLPAGAGLLQIYIGAALHAYLITIDR